jgi:hypothetical protein
MKPWHAWYKTARWQRLRARQLQSEPLCRMCLERGLVTVANTVDHIEPHKGDAAIERGGTPRPRIGLDGWPIG